MILLNLTCYDMQAVFYKYRRRSLSMTYCDCHENLLITTRIIIDIRDITTILMII